MTPCVWWKNVTFDDVAGSGHFGRVRLLQYRCFVVYRVEYAEDELSDDSDGPSQAQGSSRHAQTSEHQQRESASNSSGNTRVEHRYEEDELSDDSDS